MSDRATARAGLGAAASWAAVTFVAAIAAATLVPALVGIRSFVVMSGSMTPALRVGDVVLSQRIRPLDVRPGDVVTFRDPSGRDRLVTHRVHFMRATGATVTFVTKGDANNPVERWSVPADGTIGLVRLRIPKAGFVLVWARGPGGRLVFLVLPAILLGALGIRKVWAAGASRERAAMQRR